MGITLYCKKTGHGIDMGYAGFSRLRDRVAILVGEPFASHELQLSKPEVMFMFNQEKKDAFFKKFNARTEQLINDGKVSIKIVDFLHQSDCEGKIRYGACKEILKVIGDYDDDIAYGYCGRKDCAKFADFKALLQECVDNKSMLVWH